VKDDRVYLQHILECLDAIVGYTGEGRNRFLADDSFLAMHPLRLLAAPNSP
jgi:uncharacterized protein with HEPN domain